MPLDYRDATMIASAAVRSSRQALAVALAVMLAGACGDDVQGPGEIPVPPNPPDPPDAVSSTLSTLIVSNPLTSGSVEGATLSFGGDASEEDIVFVSLPPGSVPDGEMAVIETRSTQARATAPMEDGGFDPVPLAAAAGDTLDIRIEVGGGGAPLVFFSVVPPSVPPVIVRTDPPPKKRDVPLNAVMLLVFSEPIDPATLTTSSVQLVANGAPVAGTLQFTDGLHLTATFTPAEPLAPGVEHALLITRAIEDLDGDALDEAVTIEFTTESGQTASSYQLAVVSGDDQQGKVGAPLAEALVVRVTDAGGNPVENVEVAWWSGEGALDGQYDPDANIFSEVSTLTDGDGLAEVSLTPLKFTSIGARAYLSDDVGSGVRFSADARDPGATLAVVSGSFQQARAGYELAEPLVVRVTDGQGVAVPNLPVRWGRTSGYGWLEGDELGQSQTHTVTDALGLARVSLIPTWFGPVEVTAGVDGLASQSLFVDATDPGAGITMVSGDGQEGKAGEPLAEPFVVRVTDGQGSPAPNIQIGWSAGISQITSDGGGLAQLTATPTQVGTLTWTVRPAGVGINATVEFTAEVNVLVITLPEPGYGFNGFAGPDCGGSYECGDWSVPIGTTVEWVNQRTIARIASTSAPEGGASFDSGTLGQDERFQFVPSVAGTWEYRDLISGVAGTLTAY